jgi:hypothetical protein
LLLSNTKKNRTGIDYYLPEFFNNFLLDDKINVLIHKNKFTRINNEDYEIIFETAYNELNNDYYW